MKIVLTSFLVAVFFALSIARGEAKDTAANAKPGITRKIIEEHPIAGTNHVLQLIRVEIPVGAGSVPHVHTATALNYIISGSVESRFEGEPAKTYKAGDSYQDPPDKRHLVFKNTSHTEPLLFVLAVEVEKGQPFMKILPDPHE